jgi:hypothetical protein
MPIAIALDAALALFKRYRILIAVVPLTIALGIQTWRLNSAKDALEDCRNDKALLVAASETNRQAQIAQREKEKAAYKRAYEIAEETHAKELASAHDSLDRYIAANRLRKDHRISTPGASGEGQTAGSGQEAGGETFLVAVTERDLKICTDNTARLEAAYQWGQQLIKDGVGE